MAFRVGWEPKVSVDETRDSSARKRETSISAQRLAVQLLDDEDLEFIEALQAAGLLIELDSDELLRLASEVDESDPDVRWVDLLEVYFGRGDEETCRRRRMADGYFLQRLGAPATAAGLVGRLSWLFPEIDGVSLERIGGEDGPLVIRAGEHFCAVLDETEENLDTDQLDLRELDDDNSGPPMVTVRGLVRATNVLLDRHGVRERLISLRGDDEREVYVRLGITEAMTLAQGGYLEDDDPEDVMELAAW